MKGAQYLVNLARSRAASFFHSASGSNGKKPPYVPGQGLGAPVPTDETIVMYRQVTYRRWSDGSLRRVK